MAIRDLDDAYTYLDALCDALGAGRYQGNRVSIIDELDELSKFVSDLPEILKAIEAGRDKIDELEEDIDELEEDIDDLKTHRKELEG